MRAVSTIPLNWPDLCQRARRHSLPDHRGILISTHRDKPDMDAPIAIAACGLLAQRQAFVTEAEAELYRALAPKAQNAVMCWQLLRMDRDEVRDACVQVRRTGDRSKLPSFWRQYRRNAHRLARQIEDIRVHLTPRRPVLTVVPAVAAE